MDTYIMKTELFMEIVKHSVEVSSMYTLADMINLSCDALDVRGISHKGFFAAANDFKSYYDANISLIDLKQLPGCSMKTGRSTQEPTTPVQHSILIQQA
jgi:hypothetical protein